MNIKLMLSTIVATFLVGCSSVKDVEPVTHSKTKIEYHYDTLANVMVCSTLYATTKESYKEYLMNLLFKDLYYHYKMSDNDKEHIVKYFDFKLKHLNINRSYNACEGLVSDLIMEI